jgi:uncharacterized protein YdeI (YjbR/CyaY-like superfamily)
VDGRALREAAPRHTAAEGHDENMIGLAKATRQQAGVEMGASYDVEIALDEVERTVEVPEDLLVALATDPAVDKAFTALPVTHRKEFVRWVTEAKREATREQRVAKTVEMVRAGRAR